MWACILYVTYMPKYMAICMYHIIFMYNDIYDNISNWELGYFIYVKYITYIRYEPCMPFYVVN